MQRTIKAHYTNGRIEPSEPISLAEGTEVVVTISFTSPAKKVLDSTQSTAGAWGDLLDCEEFEEEVYENRLLSTRPSVDL